MLTKMSKKILKFLSARTGVEILSQIQEIAKDFTVYDQFTNWLCCEPFLQRMFCVIRHP